jgi:hypothetical protein
MDKVRKPNITCLLVRYHFTSYLNVRSLSVSDPWLSVSSVSHLLKRILCGLSREHRPEGSSLSVHENASVVAQRLFVATRIIVCLCRYNGNASVRCLENDVSELSPLFRLSGRTP